MRPTRTLSLALSTCVLALARGEANTSGSRSMASTTTATDAPAPAGPAPGEDVRPFKVMMPAEAMNDLRRRLQATRWTDKELVADASQGVQLATLKELVRYWSTTYDWRKAEARLNALPQFVTNIDGLDIHFIHVKSKARNALPIIITHGWPGSIIEQLKIIEPLTNPTAHGGRTEDAFD